MKGRIAIPTSQDLVGLMKFAGRDHWSDCFDEVFAEHFDFVPDVFEVEVDDLANLLGGQTFMTLWGCAFEDFLTRDFECGNIVDDYLKRRGWKERSLSKAYMKALRNSVMSLYEVSNVVPGESMMVRDLIRGGEPVIVYEKSATQTLKQWARIAVRIVSIGGRNEMSGGVLPYSLDSSEDLFEFLDDMFEEKELSSLTDKDLQSAATLFTHAWLSEALDQLFTEPALRNSDGDEMLFHSISFPLAAKVKQAEVAARVDEIPGMVRESANFWNWVGESQRDVSRQEKTHFLETMLDSGEHVLGNVEMKKRLLHLEVNSAKRAAEGRALIEQALGELVGEATVETCTVEKFSEEIEDRGDVELDIPPETQGQFFHQFMDKHFYKLLDQPMAMFDDKTPRQAVKSAEGRQKVAEWLKYVENRHLVREEPGSSADPYDFEWIWRELGVLDLRC